VQEITFMWVGVLRILNLLVASILYSLGGRSGISKGVRRFGASAVIVGGVCLFSFLNGSFHWWYLSVYPLLVGAYSLGYGGQTFLEKFKRRSISALAITCAPLPIVITTGKWEAWVTQVIIGWVSMVILGIKSRIRAAEEELIICMLTSFMVLFYV